MTLALRLFVASVVFGGMLVWWAMAAVGLMAAWLAIGSLASVSAHACRQRWVERVNRGHDG